MKYVFIDIEQLKADGWELTRVADCGCEYRREHMSLDDVPKVDVFRALMDYGREHGKKVTVIFEEEEKQCND